MFDFGEPTVPVHRLAGSLRECAGGGQRVWGNHMVGQLLQRQAQQAGGRGGAQVKLRAPLPAIVGGAVRV